MAYNPKSDGTKTEEKLSILLFLSLPLFKKWQKVASGILLDKLYTLFIL